MRSMFRAGIFFILLAGLGMVEAVAAQSVAEPRSVTVTPFVNTTFGTSNGLGGSLGLGAAIGYDLTSNLGFEGELSHAFDVLGDNANADHSLTIFSGNVVYHFDVKSVTPYATFGLGYERSSIDVKVSDPLALLPPDATEIAYNFGGGVKYPITSRMLARADLRRFQANDLAPDHWRLYGGVTLWVKQ